MADVNKDDLGKKNGRMQNDGDEKGTLFF